MKFGIDLEENIKFENIEEEEITGIKYDGELKTLFVWVKDNPYFDKVHYAWLTDSKKFEAVVRLMVKFTGDERYTRENDVLYYDGKPIRGLEYRRNNDTVRLVGY